MHCIFSFLFIVFRDSEDIVKLLFLMAALFVMRVIDSKKLPAGSLGIKETACVYISISADVVSILICFFLIKEVMDIESALVFSVLIAPVWLYPKIKVLIKLRRN